MKLIIINFLLFFVLVSCQENKKETATSLIIIDTSEKIVTQKLNSYCFFKLDDKYSTETDSLTINRWLLEKSLEILKNDSINNIFDQNGGGIHGAQKNPYSDLFVAVLLPSHELMEEPKILINGKLYEHKIYEHSPTLIWYKVRLDFWEHELKEISSGAIEKMYSADFLDYVNYKELGATDDLFTGKILEFTLSYKEEKMTKFFHAAYYE